jgi:DeoR/GlpR family transcriptional regulator of sugar metabolism
MLLAARRRVIVADGSKLGETELAKVCGIEEVSLLVTDRTADPEVIGQLVSAGCHVEVAQEAPGVRVAGRNVRAGGSR